MMHSIRSRFLVVSIVSVILAMALSSLGFISLFGRSIERRIDQELTGHINNIAGTLGFAADGALLLPDRPADSRFEEPYGGLYWQVEDDATGSKLRSASLWDYSLPLPEDDQEPGVVHRYHLAGPDNSDLIVQERMVIFEIPDAQRVIRIAAAIDATVVAEARNDFAADLFPYMLALAAFLIAASLAQLSFGLRPVSSVSEGLNRIHERQAERLTGRYPRELQGVVDAMNRLLDAQSDIISKARARAADLAHGLKTPLTVLSNDAATLRERGETEIADELVHLATVMQAHVDHELTRSRIAASADLRSSDADVLTGVDRIVRTLKRTPKGEALSWTIAIPPKITVAIDPHDLEELLGNILENAMKWANSAIVVRLESTGGWPTLVIEDDGPGADPDRISRMTERGVRLDMKTPGTGLGLSIVRDIADVYGIVVDIDNRETGGLRIALTFKQADAAKAALAEAR